jgi:hypothetical protein
MRKQHGWNRWSNPAQWRGVNGWTGNLRLAPLAVLLAVGVVLGAADATPAQGTNQRGGPFPAMSTFQAGMITGVHGTTVQINGKDYDLQPNVQIKKPDGMVMEAQNIRKGALAQFHLKQGKIDQLVVLLPD